MEGISLTGVMECYLKFIVITMMTLSYWDQIINHRILRAQD